MDFFCEHPSASSSPIHAASFPAPPPPSSPSSRPHSYDSSVGEWDAGRSGREGFVVSKLARSILSAALTCVFAMVGSFVGAITGGLIGLATESGLFRGAGIGAISGAVFSIEAVESSLAIWHSNGSGIWSIIFVLDIILSLLSGRLVREKVGPAVQSAVQSQISAIDTPFREVFDIFEIGDVKGMARDSVENIPKMVITAENNVDASGDAMSCSVCLQDFEVGETVRSLPHCRHMFHLPCIDSWLVRHGSCPLCRRDF